MEQPKCLKDDDLKQSNFHLEKFSLPLDEEYQRKTFTRPTRSAKTISMAKVSESVAILNELQLQDRLCRNRLYARQQRAAESFEECYNRSEAQRRRWSLRKANETAEDRAERLKESRKRAIQRRENETSEVRDERLNEKRRRDHLRLEQQESRRAYENNILLLNNREHIIIEQDSLIQMEEIGPYVKQGKSLDEKVNKESNIKRDFKLKLRKDDKKYSEIERAYLDFATKKMYLGKGYKRQNIIDYLRRDVPGLDKIKIENPEFDLQVVQIFENESNISLSLSDRLSILDKFSLYSGVRYLSKFFKCNAEDVRKTLKRHITYVKEWEDVILYSPHTSFTMEDLDTILYFWTCECTLQKYPITKNSLKHTANPIAKLLDIEMFKASDYWLDYFVSKYDIQLRIESSKVLEQAAKAVRTVKISNVITKHLKNFSKSVKEKFGTKNKATKPYTYEKKLKNCEVSREIFSAIGQTAFALEINSVIAKNTEKASASSILDKPIFEFIETDDNFPVTNIKIENEEVCGSTIKNSINDSIIQQLEQVSNGLDKTVINKKRKIERDQADVTTTNVVPNITIESYEHALKYLKPIEEFVMLKSNFRAINYLNCLQNVLKELNKS